MSSLSQVLTFVPADPPRHSWFALWDPDDPGGLVGLGAASTTTGLAESAVSESATVELALPAARGTARTTVAARKLRIGEAIDMLVGLGHSDTASPAAHAWSTVVRTALSLIADGKVLPWVSADGWDCWRLDPVDATDHARLVELAEALPAAAHATPVPGRGRMSDPLFTVRAVCDAIADAFIRTPAAHRIGPLRVFADPAPTRVRHLRPWVHDIASAHCSTARLVLRMVPPGSLVATHTDTQTTSSAEANTPDAPPTEHASDAEDDWTICFELRSRVDPSLAIEASTYWSSPVEVLERLGNQAESVLLAGLRTVAELVEPLNTVLDDFAPTHATLANAEIDSLLDALDALSDADISVRWPAELIAPRVERRLVVGAGSPPSGLAPLLGLGSALDVDWEFLIDGIALSADELRVLAGAKRSVVSLRGKWVRLDRATLERLREPPPKLTPGAALALALGADIEIPGVADDEPVQVRVVGSFDEFVARVSALTGTREQPEPAALRAELRSYQRRGLAWMADLAALGLGGCLADDMGLGKTIQVLSLHASLNHTGGRDTGGRNTGGPMLVVCPTSLMHNWKSEAAKFIPDTPVRLFHGPNRNLDALAPDEIVIATYGVVRSDATILDTIEWSVVAADEAQHVKNPRSRSARALRQIRHGVRLALTGTPVENKLSELWAIFDWAVPGLLGPLETFRRTTGLPIERDNDRAAAKRLQKLLAPFLLRRHKSDPGIAPELPAKVERDVVVPLTPEQVTLYRATVDSSLEEVASAEGIARRGLVLKLLTGLKQITNHPAQFLGETGPLDARSGKLSALEELMAATSSAAEVALIFSQYVAMGRLLVDHLTADGYRCDLLHGALSIKARQELVDQVQAGELDALVLSLKAGGTGLNLTRATHVIHYDRWWNPAVEDQATDRAYRIGQDRMVTVHRLITQGTVEDKVASLIAAKRELASAVTGSGESWIGELDDDDLAELVSLSSVSSAPTIGPDAGAEAL